MMRKSEIARMAAAAICATLLAGLAACGTAAPAGSDASAANPGAQPDSSIVIQEATSGPADGGHADHTDHAEHAEHADATATQADQAAADTATAGDSAATDTTSPATTAASTGGGSGCCNE
ncbi:hypothetical protein [Bifidobacterium vespertilionis]|uniref:Uncharacterized protein n=1 Tax=Bifidobacterium vespertilionis TaxID=2562524 RepID=A0A5J5DVU2_9BIFI|nr:hypothetical protein [Bifidobacterium vespertilionis]KAA8819028.1 hypothetical protein EMO90_08725 [Bifidobacterium vespertilionis]KAA8821039.1 hypothetical protein EM848_11510 [Bifidobacterium vespertilionis]